MKLIIILGLLLFTGCSITYTDQKITQLFFDTYKDGCYRVYDVRLQGINYGDFVLCRYDEYIKRTEK